MSKKPVAVTLRKPQAPDLDGFVGGPSAQAPVHATPADPIDRGADVRHGARDYRELTLYLPTDVARALSLYCMDHDCDVNRVVAEAVSKHVSGAPEPTAGIPNGRLGGALEVIVAQLRAKLSTFWPLRP